MAGFGGSTGVSKGYVDRAIAQSTANLIYAGNVDGSKSITLSPTTGGSHLLILSRQNNDFFLVLAYDIWSEGYTVIGGQEKSGITVTKAGGTNVITINNTLGFGFNYKLI